MIIDENGTERLSVEGKLLGNPPGIGGLGAVGVRQARYMPKHARAGSDPHARIADMDLEDQQLGGIIMWIPGCLIFLAFAPLALAPTLSETEPQAYRSI